MNKFSHFALTIAVALPLAAQTPATANQNDGISRQQADNILKELRQIRQLLERQAANAAPAPKGPQRASLDLTGVEMIGVKNAPLTIVEYSDYQCPFCQRFHVVSFPEIKKNYIDTGKVRFFSKDLP